MRKIKDVLCLKLDAKLSHQQIVSALGLSKGILADAAESNDQNRCSSVRHVAMTCRGFY